jgi:hypothetical protein
MVGSTPAHPRTGDNDRHIGIGDCPDLVRQQNSKSVYVGSSPTCVMQRYGANCWYSLSRVEARRDRTIGARHNKEPEVA